jgi:hypothetical protein
MADGSSARCSKAIKRPPSPDPDPDSKTPAAGGVAAGACCESSADRNPVNPGGWGAVRIRTNGCSDQPTPPMWLPNRAGERPKWGHFRANFDRLVIFPHACCQRHGRLGRVGGRRACRLIGTPRSSGAGGWSGWTQAIPISRPGQDGEPSRRRGDQTKVISRRIEVQRRRPAKTAGSQAPARCSRL